MHTPCKKIVNYVTIKEINRIIRAHTINACRHANSSVHENMQSLIEQSGSVRKYAKDEIIYLQGDTAQSFCYIKKGSVKVYMNSVDGNEKTLNTARHGEIIGEGAFFDKKPGYND